ncbi:MAG: uncharacterized protein K0Q72_4723 [Armatimonadetes bacterium]|jgi:ribosomal protein S18 acetylase RimI-like enzyme|nr:uncharacterized protein [Armatimonadota bacterium]
MKAYVSATWGWDETFQRRYFREHANPDRTQILLVQGEPAGALTVWEQDDALFLASIELLPEHQRRGLGTAIIENLCHEAAERGLPVALQVLKVNPAFRLYERLGFRTVRETETHFQMRYGD